MLEGVVSEKKHAEIVMLGDFHLRGPTGFTGHDVRGGHGKAAS